MELPSGALPLERQHLNPVIVGVVDEVEPHVVVLEAYPAVGAVVFAHGVVVACHTDAEVALVVAQLVGTLLVAQPGELEVEVALAVAQEDQLEGAVLGLLASFFMQAERTAVEVDAALEVGYVDVEMVEFAFDFHGFGF